MLIPAIFAAACGEGDSTTTAEQPAASATTAEEPEAGAPAAGAPGPEGPEPDGDTEGAEPAQPLEATAAATAEDAIRAVLTAAGDPEQACTHFVTSRFVTTAYGGRANCIAARRPNALADSLRITAEGAGEFTVVPEGGPYDGVEVTVEVVDEGGYRVSSLLADIPAGP